MQRPIFLSGKVVLEDGTPPPEAAVIERVCNGVTRPEGYTDSKGRFSFQLGQNTQFIPDASWGGSPSFGGMGGGTSSTGGFGSTTGISERDLSGCELRASLAGYISDVLPLVGRRALDNPNVGTIVLRRYGNVEGTTISATSMAAPNNAKKAYEKGLDEKKKEKWANARKQFEGAVKQYPRYAAAWYELGFAAEKLGDAEGVRTVARIGQQVRQALPATGGHGGQRWDLAGTGGHHVTGAAIGPLQLPWHLLLRFGGPVQSEARR